jgi:PsbP
MRREAVLLLLLLLLCVCSEGCWTRNEGRSTDSAVLPTAKDSWTDSSEADHVSAAVALALSHSCCSFAGVSDLGSPEAAADRILDQYLNKEFMSTRLGVRREGEVLAAAVRQGDDGRTYYDIDVRMTSYASRSPYVATQGELMADYGVEWDRRLLTTLGVANKRLYELRLQTDAASYDSDRAVLDTIRRSFRVVEVEQT